LTEVGDALGDRGLVGEEAGVGGERKLLFLDRTVAADVGSVLIGGGARGEHPAAMVAAAGVARVRARGAKSIDGARRSTGRGGDTTGADDDRTERGRGRHQATQDASPGERLHPGHTIERNGFALERAHPSVIDGQS